MKRHISGVGILSLMLVLFAMLITSCAGDGPKRLSVPKVSVTGQTLSWSALDGAAGYEVQRENGELESLRSDVTEFSGEAGERLRVRALGDGIRSLDSEWSEYFVLEAPGHVHVDENEDAVCDGCNTLLYIVIDFYSINDLHGKFCDTDSQPGVDELSTYIRNARQKDDHVILLSAGDMWQGSAESVLTNGAIMMDWMNELDFAAMTLGNHEYDWGEDPIRQNRALSEFPFLAINIYDNATGRRVDYCEPSVMVDLGVAQIGVIGAMGDCYSSISSDKVTGVHFKTGGELAELVNAEAERLRAEGADFIVLTMHDGYSEYVTNFMDVDIFFEGHSHQAYVEKDSRGKYHLQGGGENYGISHAEIQLSLVDDAFSVTEARTVRSTVYRALADDAATEAIEDSYREIIDFAYTVIGHSTYGMHSGALAQAMAELYLETAIETWGDAYDIVLGGGYIKTRAPYDLAAGDVCYADLLSLFPFNNPMVLCTISGENLMEQFINNNSYAVSLSEYGESILSSIDRSATYYVMVDSYTQLYARNGLTAVAYLDDTTFARDLMAAAFARGRLQ